jgi:putative phosphoribosyl transferase
MSWTRGGDGPLRVFADRREAGALLADRLAGEGVAGGVVVGLARGGVAVAAEVAARLALPLDALAVRKVTHPERPEYGIGAVTPDGRITLMSGIDLDAAVVEAASAAAAAAAAALDLRLHERGAPVDVAGRTCVLVDDGLATGATMVAAARWARARGAARVVVAVPVGPAETIELIERESDAVVCLQVPALMLAVGEWYEDFRQVSTEEVAGLLAEAARAAPGRQVEIAAGGVELAGELTLPGAGAGVVIFAHGSGSSRLSPRNRTVADRLVRAGLATLLFDLLTPREERNRAHVFDIPLLAGRLAAATRWARRDPAIGGLPIGYFGASTGAAAALWAAADDPAVRAIVSRGGRPDLAAPHLSRVRAPTLLIVGGDDDVVLGLNRRAAAEMRCPAELVVIPGATHLFEEPGTLEQVADTACEWLLRHLAPDSPAAGAAMRQTT